MSDTPKCSWTRDQCTLGKDCPCYTPINEEALREQEDRLYKQLYEVEYERDEAIRHLDENRREYNEIDDIYKQVFDIIDAHRLMLDDKRMLKSTWELHTTNAICDAFEELASKILKVIDAER